MNYKSVEFGTSLTHSGWENADPGTDGPRMALVGACASGSPQYLCIDLDGAGGGTNTFNATASTGSLGLNTGDTAVIYFKVNNGTLTTLDAGATTTVGIFAGVAGGPLSISIVGQS